MVTLRFDWRDLLRATRVAFSFQRLWIQFIGLLVGYLGYVILTYVALLVSGDSFVTVWSKFGLCPGIIGLPLSIPSKIIYGLGLFILLCIWMITGTGVARATYMSLKGNTFYTWKEALRYALKKIGSVVFTPITILIIFALIGAGGVVIGFLGKIIPYAGELGISLFAIIWFMAALFLVFVILALAVSLLQTPAVIATTDDDAFEGIFQSFSILYGQPWRLIFYEIIVLVLAVFGLGIFAFFAKRAWMVLTTVFIWGMGDKYMNLSYGASGLLQSLVYPLFTWVKAFIGDYSSHFFFAHHFTAIELSAVMTVATWIYAIFMLFIGSFILCYPFAIFNVGNTLIFLILKKIKDDENLLERKDREEEDEEEEEVEEEKKEVKKAKPKTKAATTAKEAKKTTNKKITSRKSSG